mgnify:FL=1
MIRLSPAAFLLIFAAHATAQKIELPPTFSTPVGETLDIAVSWEGRNITAIGTKAAGKRLSVVRTISDDPKTALFTVWAMVPGEFELFLVASSETGAQTKKMATVYVGISPPGPPGPGPQPPTPPGPGPNPPTPPTPGPTPPPLPSDPFAIEVKKAFDEDAPPETPKRAEGKAHAAKFAAFYSACKKFAADENKVKTVGDFLDAYGSAANDSGFLPPGALERTRKTVGLKIAALLGTDLDKQIDPDLRKALLALIELILTVLSILGV